MTRIQSALKEHEKQMAHTMAVMELICAQRGMRRAFNELKSGRAGDALVALQAALSSADRALEDMEALTPGASSMREPSDYQRLCDGVRVAMDEREAV